MDPTYLSPQSEEKKESCSFRKINNFVGRNGTPVAGHHSTESLGVSSCGSLTPRLDSQPHPSPSPPALATPN